VNVYVSGWYLVRPSDSAVATYETTNGDLDSFNSAAGQAVEASKRDTSRNYSVWFYPNRAPADPVKVGYAWRGQWLWRSQ
jgi:hypothetical protein